MKRILILLASIAAFVLPMLAFAPAAQAATGVVTNGTGWTGSLTANGPENRCTLAAVGYDQYGNKIAISAAHCVSQSPGPLPGGGWSNGNYVPDGGPVYEWTPNNGPRKHIGNIAYRSWNGTGYPVPVDQVNPNSFGTDYVVIKLNADADLRSNGPGARIDGIGVANPGLFTNMCKDGIGSGITCGIVVGDSPTRIFTAGLSTGGDSGGPLFAAGTTKISGYVRGIAASGTSFEYVKFSAVLNEINSPGSPLPEGKGCSPVNN